MLSARRIRSLTNVGEVFFSMHCGGEEWFGFLHSVVKNGDAKLNEEQVKDHLHWLRIEKPAAPGTLEIAIERIPILLPPDLRACGPI